MIKFAKLFGSKPKVGEPLAEEAGDTPPVEDPAGFRTVYELYPKIDKLRLPEHFPDIKEEFFWQTYEKCKAYSLLGIETFYNVYRSVEYIAVNKIPGEFVE